MGLVSLKKADLRSDEILQMAHDLRAPLTALKVLLSLDTIQDPRVKSLAVNALQRMEAIAQGILDANKQFTTPSLIECLKNIIEEFKLHSTCNFTFETKNCDHLESLPEPLVQTIQRISSILISNAIEASVGNSGISILVERKSSQLVIEIKDNGNGILEEDLESLGNKGFTKNKTNGNGLGLSFVKEKLKELNGKMTIHSKVRVGTSVKIEFNLY